MKKTSKIYSFEEMTEKEWQSLIASGNVEVFDIWGRSALFYVCFSHKFNLVKRLIKAGVNVHFKNKNGVTPLHSASNNKITKILIEAGAYVNAVDTNGQTPIYWTLGVDDEILQTLIEAGVYINKIDKNGNTPLHSTPSLNTIKILLKNGADIFAKDNADQTPLEKVLNNFHTSSEKKTRDKRYIFRS